MNILIFNPDAKEAQSLERQVKALGEEKEKQLKAYCFADSANVLKSKIKFDIAVTAFQIILV